MKTFIKYLGTGKADLAIELAIPAGLWLVVEIFANGMMLSDSSKNALGIGGIVAFATVILMELFTVGARVTVNFNLGVSMGRTRRFMLGAMLGESALHLAASLGLVALLGLAGQGISLALGAQRYENILFLMPWWAWLVAFFGVLILGFCGGMLLWVFGRKGFWALWVVGMLGLVPANTSAEVVESTFQTLRLPMIILAAVLIPAWTIWSVWQALRISVK